MSTRPRFTCQCCGYSEPYNLWVWNRAGTENTMHRCTRCGVPHSCRQGREAEAISPPLAPWRCGKRVSPWFSIDYKPHVIGVFEVATREGLTVRLWWNGHYWHWCGLRVDISAALKWRGVWLTDQECS